MCVLIVKYKGVNLPSKNIISACIKANPDGFGFVTPSKLFKTLDAKAFVNELYKIDISEPAIIHCRWATHGSIKPENCHPFISEDGKMAFAHNGILSIRPEGDLTDSETAFRHIFYPALQKGGFNAKNCALVDKVRGGSKFAFMQGETIYTFGEFTALNGVLFSNMRWQSQLRSRQAQSRFYFDFLNS